MGNFVFNCSKGRVAEMYNRVDTNDPANSALVVVGLATSGLESDATLIDLDTLAAVVAGATNEVTNTNYARKVLTDSDLSAMAPDDTNDWMQIAIPNQTWSAVASGDGWSKLLVCYDGDTTGGSDSNVIPLTAHDFVIVPDGSDIIANFATNGVYRAS